MRTFILFFCLMFGLGHVAQAQDFGIIAGVHQSNASSNSSYSTASEFGFQIGGTVSVPLTEEVSFHSGLQFTQRHFDLKDSVGDTLVMSFDYIDVPALVQYNFNDMVGIYGGLIVAFNTTANASVSGPNSSAIPTSPTGVKSMLPLFQIGINGTFNNQFGIQAYYEFGASNIFDGASNYAIYGANFIYWL